MRMTQDETNSAPCQLFVFGAGGHAKVVIDAMELLGLIPEAVFDDDSSRKDGVYCGYAVLGGMESLCARRTGCATVIVAIARNDVRRFIVGQLMNRGFPLCGVRHPRATISPRASVSSTAQILAGVLVNPDAVIGEHVLLNTGCIIEHDSQVSDFAHVGPGAVLAGAVKVSEGAFVGSGATVRPFVNIGAWATVGAGAVVVGDVPEGAVVAGVPAVPLPKSVAKS